MITIRVTREPTFTIAGDSYDVSAPITAYDEHNRVVASTTVVFVGLISEVKHAARFMARLKNASDAWKTTLITDELMQIKLSGLVGKVL